MLTTLQDEYLHQFRMLLQGYQTPIQTDEGRKCVHNRLLMGMLEDCEECLANALIEWRDNEKA